MWLVQSETMTLPEITLYIRRALLRKRTALSAEAPVTSETMVSREKKPKQPHRPNHPKRQRRKTDPTSSLLTIVRIVLSAFPLIQ